LRSACTPAAVTLPQKRTSRAVSAGRLLTAVPLDIPSPSSSLLLLYHCSHSLVCHLVEVGEVERGQRRQAAHCMHTLVCHAMAIAEVERRESSAAAHCSPSQANRLRRLVRYCAAPLVFPSPFSSLLLLYHCSQRLVRQHALSVSILNLQRRHRREPSHQHAHASSVVTGLSTSRFTIASCTAFHPVHTSRIVAVARKNPSPPSLWGLLRPAACSIYSTFSTSSSGSSAHPPFTVARCPRVRSIVDLWTRSLSQWDGARGQNTVDSARTGLLVEEGLAEEQLAST
jgi:hypothetical protein